MSICPLIPVHEASVDPNPPRHQTFLWQVCEFREHRKLLITAKSSVIPYRCRSPVAQSRAASAGPYRWLKGASATPDSGAGITPAP